METIGFVNQKGGGKSFTAKVVANALAGVHYKKRVILLDCDDEQTTSADFRQRDFAVRDEFRYPIATCLPSDLPAVMAGRKPLQMVTQGGFVSQPFDEDMYDYALVDMPGRGQSKDISGLLACLDYAVIVIKGDDSESLSTIKFLKTIVETQKLREQHDMEPLRLALMYNEFENTDIYRRTFEVWEKVKLQHDMYKEVLYLSKKETYKKYNDTYTDMLSVLNSNKALPGLHKEFSSFMTKLVTFLNQ
jgi:cellulose biosynthesis protein BcsQ